MTAALDAIRDALATALFMRYGSVERGWYRVRHEWGEDADVILGTLPLAALNRAEAVVAALEALAEHHKEREVHWYGAAGHVCIAAQDAALKALEEVR